MLTLYEPTLEDMWFRQMMLADEETMSYNHAWGGTISWPEEEWKDWYDYSIANPQGEWYYRYLKNEEGQFVGEISYHFNKEYARCLINVIVFSKFRGKGYGVQGLELLCAAAKENGIEVLYDDIAIDNPSITLFLNHGFTEEYRTEEIIVLKKELK